MTLAGAGADALSPNIALAFPSTNDGSIPGRAGLTEGPVREMLKAAMLESEGWNFASDTAFGGLDRTGIPLVLNIIQSMVARLFGWVTDFPGVADALEAIEEFPLFGIVRQITNMLLGIEDPAPLVLVLPVTIPATLVPAGGLDNPVVVFIKNALAFLNIDNWLSGEFNPIAEAIKFIEGILKPTGLLAWLDGGLLPDGLAPQIVGDIIDTIESVLTGILPANLISPIFDTLKTILGIGETAQTSANNANTAVAGILARLNADAVPGGVQIIENFDEPAATALPAARWSQAFGFGPGSTLGDGPDGDGDLVWRETGGGVYGSRNRHRSALATNNQTLSVLFPKRHGRYNWTNCSTILQLRMNAAENQWVGCELKPVSDTVLRCTMYVNVGGTTTQIGSSVDVNDQDGDVFTFRAGTTATPYGLELSLNDNTKLSVVDALHVSVLNSSTNVYPAVTRISGVGTFLFVVFTSRKPPDISIFAAADRQV